MSDAINDRSPMAADLRRYLDSPEGRAQISAYVAEVLIPRAPQIAAWAEEIARGITPMLKRFAEWSAAFVRLPRTEYENLLLDLGYEEMEAKLTAHAICYFGTQWAEERNAVAKPLGSLIRELARKSTRGTLAVSRRAMTMKPLLDYGESRHVIEKALSQIGSLPSFGDFCDLVDKAANRDEDSCLRLRHLAPAMARHMPDSRGRYMSTATACHIFLLRILDLDGRPRAYTWKDAEEDFVDAATKATRAVANDHDFNPCPARRLLKSGKLF